MFATAWLVFNGMQVLFTKKHVRIYLFMKYFVYLQTANNSSHRRWK